MIKSKGWISAFLLALATTSTYAKVPFNEPRPIIQIANGKLQGVERDGMVMFKNIPYAAPPVGELRWRPPQPPKNWSGVRDASKYGEACPQPLVFGYTNELVPGNEDCLKLSIYAPKDAKDRPVMVWIHGGGLTSGASWEPYYYPPALIREGVIVVSIDYRMGRLGFFAPQELIDEAKAKGEPFGNYAIMDQIQALKWVRDNIANFGGDAKNVTIFGESAGGRSVIWLMTSPAAEGLFHKAIAQSANQLPMRHLNKEVFGKPGVIENDNKFIASKGRKSLAEMRALPTDEVILTPQDFAEGNFDSSFIDGQIIVGDPLPLFAQGKHHKVPMMIGTLKWDASLFTIGGVDKDSFIKMMGQDSKIIDRLYAQYPAQCDNAIGAQLMADGFFTGAVKFIADSANKSAPSYAYHFSYLAPTLRNKYIGPAHGFEIPYVFGGLDTVYRAPAKMGSPANLCKAITDAHALLKDKGHFSAYWVPTTAPNRKEDQDMSLQMSKSWASFAKTGNPNYDGKNVWPRYDISNDVIREFTNGRQGTVKNLNKERVDYQMKFLKALYQMQ
jgi:para-nitrobenzyl esterase